MTQNTGSTTPPDAKRTRSEEITEEFLEDLRRSPAVGSLAVYVANLEWERDRYQVALKEIGARGTVFDAKGTWSQRVHDIAKEALRI